MNYFNTYVLGSLKEASHRDISFWYVEHTLYVLIKSIENMLSYDIASGGEIKQCNKIDKPLVVYRFSGNIMRSITTLRT